MADFEKLNLVKITVSIDDLLLDPNNPRFAKHPDDMTPLEQIADDDVQDMTFNKMLSSKGFEVHEVEESIRTKGFVPIDNIFVRKVNEKYLVVEGNRRISAVKNLHIKHNQGGKGALPAEIYNTILEFDVFDLTDNKPDEIDYILGLRHVGSIKQWELLPSSFNIFKRYMKEYCEEYNVENKVENFKYDATIAKIVAKLYSVRLSEVRDKLKTYRAYYDINEELHDRGLDKLPEEKFSLVGDTISRPVLRERFRFEDSQAVFQDEGLDLFIDLMVGDGDKKRPVITAAAAGDSNLRDFAFVVAEGTEEDIERITSNREKTSEVKADVVSKKSQRSLLKRLEFALSELKKIQIGEIEELGHAEQEMLEFMLYIIGKLRSIAGD